MSGVDFRGLQVHPACGAEVLPFVGLGDGRVLVERVMRPGPTGLEMVVHQCRDYVDWHRSVPDVRDVDTLDVAGGWQRQIAVPVVAA